jgi:hypothetical protein
MKITKVSGGRHVAHLGVTRKHSIGLSADPSQWIVLNMDDGRRDVMLTLSRDQAADLARHLLAWVETGSLEVVEAPKP